MTRQTTITLDGVQYMIDIDIERRSSDMVYHILMPQHFRNDLPETFDIIKPEDAEEPRYSEHGLSEKGKKIIREVWHQLNTLPPQFKGRSDKGTGKA